ncbi:MAG: DUF1700 domain-containing protein [Lachnospiraceae bacterium]|jgi:hypothetical protein|nr:DUF1700 domain-containing protein [Lachnospiraceae bacterium]
MKKQEFLDELRVCLLVLQDEEQDDIIDEYSQHIEMKMENGLSEEEAIKDFGPIRELAAEILEAYHVKADFEQPENRKFSERIYIPEFLSKAKENGHGAGKAREWGKRTGEFTAKIGKRLLAISKACVSTCLSVFTWPFRIGKQIGGSWMEKRKEKVFASGNEEKREMIGASRKKAVRAGNGLFQLCRMLAAWIVSCVFWWCRLIWNICVISAAAGLAVCGLIFLYLFGLLIVLCTQGYPIFGVVLGCFGAVLCFISLSVLGCTFFWMKPKNCGFHPAAEKEIVIDSTKQWEMEGEADE